MQLEPSISIFSRHISTATHYNYKNAYDRSTGKLPRTNIPYGVRQNLENRNRMI